MSGGIFGTLHPFYEGGCVNGRKVANAGFMDALLAVDPFAEYHFFVGNPQALQGFLAEREHLPAVRRKAVLTLPRTELPARLAATDYAVFHFSDPIDDFVKLASLRNACARTLFPITCLTHSINYQSYAAAFLAHIWPGCSPRDALGCNSHAARAVIEQYFTHLRAAYSLPDSIPAPRLAVQHLGVAAARLRERSACQQARHAMRQRLGVPATSCLVLLFGRISLADKLDIQPLLLALRRLRERQELDVHLVVGGFQEPNDNACDFLRHVAQLLGLALHLAPNPDEADKAALFAAADIFASPSDNIQETFGLSLLEAGAAALPVVAADWDGYRDIIVDGETGILAPTLAPAATPELDAAAPGLFDNQLQYLRSQQTAISVPAMAQAIARLAADPALRERMGNAAQERVRAHFTWEGAIARWCAFWEELRAVPLDGPTEQRLRQTRHPLALPQGEIFAAYASAHPTPDTVLAATALGADVRSRRLPLEIAGKLPPQVSEERARQALTLARRPLALATLAPRLAGSPEEGLALLLWLLKHDLLEIQ